MMTKAEDVHAYIERQSSEVAGDERIGSAKPDPYSYDAFAGAVRAKRLR